MKNTIFSLLIFIATLTSTQSFAEYTPPNLISPNTSTPHHLKETDFYCPNGQRMHGLKEVCGLDMCVITKIYCT